MSHASRSTRKVFASLLAESIEGQRATLASARARHAAIHEEFRTDDGFAERFAEVEALLAQQDDLLALARVTCSVDGTLDLDDADAGLLERANLALVRLQQDVSEREDSAKVWGAYV